MLDRLADLVLARPVAFGLQRTGGIITAAAIHMATVFLALASGNVTYIQLVGIGLALAIISDATLVRSLRVPAFMVVAGRWNWWPSTGLTGPQGANGSDGPYGSAAIELTASSVTGDAELEGATS